MIVISVLVVGLGHSAVSLHLAYRHRQMVVSAKKGGAGAVDLHFRASLPDGRASIVQGFADRDQFPRRTLAIRKLHMLRRARVNIHRAEERLLSNQRISED